MKTYLIFFLTFILPAICIGQTNYKQGYIVTNSNDTVYGRIDYRTDAMNANRCKFLAEGNPSDVVYYPGDIKAYRFTPDGKYYVSHEITINNAPQQVFLEYLVQGMVDLYYCDINGLKYYFFEKDGKMVEMTKKPDVIEQNKAIIDNKYVGIVSYYFKDYPTIANSARKMKFDQKSFINIAQLYHAETCTTGEECIVYVNKRPDESSVKFKFSAYAGMLWNTYTLTSGNDSYTLKQFDLNSTQPVIGAKMNMYNPRWSRSFSVQLDISLTRFDASDTWENTLTKNYDFESLILSEKVGIEYTLPLKKIRPKIGATGIFTQFLSENGKFTYVDNNWSDNEFDYKLRTSYIGYSLNFGIDYVLSKDNAIFVQASMQRYTKSEATEHHGRDKFKSYNIVLGYTF